MKRFDCFTFFDELELLELRLTLLDEVVDYFVICEATEPHASFKKKPLYFLENQDRFEAWQDKIIYLHVDLPRVRGLDGPPPNAKAAFLREQYQRAHLAQGLSAANENDLIYISDIDEIPYPEAYVDLKPGMAIGMLWDVYYVGLRSMERWWGTVCGTIKDDLNVMNRNRFYDLGGLKPGAGPQLKSFIPNGGLHLSWLGGYERAVSKQYAYCHPQMQSVDLIENMRKSQDVYGSHLCKVQIGEEYPDYLRAKLLDEWAYFSVESMNVNE